MNLNLIIIAVVATAFLVVGYTAYQRHDAVQAERGKTATATAVVTNKAVKVKNEIRNRSYSDDAINLRMLAGTW